jgi:diketogulonate reductase-like aldo/keto reductase
MPQPQRCHRRHDTATGTASLHWARTLQAIRLSLDRLQLAYIDVLQFHAWTFHDPRWFDALRFLQELVDEGLIKNIGVTNFDTALELFIVVQP